MPSAWCTVAGVEPSGAAGGGGRGEDADRALRVEARAEVLRADGQPDARADLDAGHDRGEQRAAVEPARLADRERGRER